jgi:hypothetical protein
MRNLFLVLAKLFGVLQFCSALTSLVQIGSYFATSGGLSSILTSGNVAFLVETASFLVVWMGTAWLLLARTEWLADRLGIHDGPEITGLDREPLLVVGVTLIGIYLTVQAIPELAGELAELGARGFSQINWRPWNRIFASVVRLGLGLFLTLKSAKVIEMIPQRKTPTQPTDAS